MMMQMLHRGGLAALTDAVRSADEDNPRGYFELERVKQTKDDPGWLEAAPGKVVKLISRLLLDLPEPSEGRRYQIIFMRRDLDEVLRSQKKMLVRRGEEPADGEEADTNAGEAQAQSDADMKELFVSHLEEVESWLRSRSDVEALFVSYNRTVSAPRKSAERINGFLGGVLDVDAMVGEIDPDLYRNRKPAEG
ncbi:type I phosphodiesterase/nucleotide pyrophosphatase [Haliangium ochraceum DSM 14365]|uniref:Type I phosphodiesterase/nucleotide pyrophosphatase n=2 Tax=Haliangium ochraceum TaxID=80816 RepID=D0LI09_HALO1|nr:type I phosphodiesterase/nucleotide pyrophosphatase [Haliangium ochraceum DSM 14365]